MTLKLGPLEFADEFDPKRRAHPMLRVLEAHRGKPCSRCKRQPGTRLNDQQWCCKSCAKAVRLDRRVKLLREARAALRAHR